MNILVPAYSPSDCGACWLDLGSEWDWGRIVSNSHNMLMVCWGQG